MNIFLALTIFVGIDLLYAVEFDADGIRPDFVEQVKGGPAVPREIIEPPIIIDFPRPFPHPPFPPIEPEDDCNNNDTDYENTTNLFSNLTSADAVDLCFLVDITGSMQPYIDAVKDSIRTVVTYLTTSAEDREVIVKNLRVAFVGYRDFSDEVHFEIEPFTTNIDKFSAFLDNIRADGGGDGPEDVFGGMEKTTEQNWESEVRVVLHMADATCHGRKCDGTQDRLERTPEGLFRQFKKLNLKYNFGEITRQTKSMIEWFSEAQGEPVSTFDLGFDVCGSRGRDSDFSDLAVAELGFAPAPLGAAGMAGRRSQKVGIASAGAILKGIKEG